MIAILDWGIGGIATLVELRRALPNVDLVYRSDSGFAPYGTVAADALATRITAVARDLDSRFGLQALVLACNAASTVTARLSLPFPVFDVIGPGITLAHEAHAAGARRIGIIGGQRTMDANLHGSALSAARIASTSVSAQPLSAHVEAGRLSGPELMADLVPVVDALGEIDALLLACTHYPALLPTLRALRPAWTMLDPAARLVRDVASATPDLGAALLSIETSGDPTAMARAALAAFGVTLSEIGVRAA